MVNKFKSWCKNIVWPNHFALDHLSRKLKSVWRARFFYLKYQLRKRIYRAKINRMKKNHDFCEVVSIMENALSRGHPLLPIYQRYLPTMSKNKKQGVFRRVS